MGAPRMALFFKTASGADFRSIFLLPVFISFRLRARRIRAAAFRRDLQIATTPLSHSARY